MQRTAIAVVAPGFAHSAAAADLLGDLLRKWQRAGAHGHGAVAQRLLDGHGLVRWGGEGWGGAKPVTVSASVLHFWCNREAKVLTDAVFALGVEQVAGFAQAPVAPFGVEALGVLADPRQQALVDICEICSMSPAKQLRYFPIMEI